MSVSWIVSVFAIAVACLIALLWWRDRNAASISTYKRGEPKHSELEPNTDYKLISLTRFTEAGISKNHGVARAATGGPELPFITSREMSHLEIGDSFCIENEDFCKIENVSISDTIPSDPAEYTKLAEVPVPVDDDMTVMFTPGSIDTVLQQESLGALPYIEVVVGSEPGVRHTLHFGRVTIGRADSNVIILDDSGASRNHCEIVFEDTNFVIRDLQSANGTFRNHSAVTEQFLEFGDQIVIGDMAFLYNCEGYESIENNKEAAIKSFELCLDIEPRFLPVLRNLAFLLEQDVSRKKEAQPLWDRVAELENFAKR